MAHLTIALPKLDFPECGTSTFDLEGRPPSSQPAGSFKALHLMPLEMWSEGIDPLLTRAASYLQAGQKPGDRLEYQVSPSPE